MTVGSMIESFHS